MNRTLCISDLHIGVQRSGGTTPASAAALRTYAIEQYNALLTIAEERGADVLINGDMFDTYNIPLSDLLLTYEATADWLESSEGKRLRLIPGNHCLSKSSANLSSFELLARLLMARYFGQVTYLQGGKWVNKKSGVYVISHVPNQEIFDQELATVPQECKVLFLHANWDNVFAGQSDHSLNITRAQAKELVKRDITIVMGHEHQGRTMFDDKVIVVGNQFPTSVADCLTHGDGQTDGRKYCLLIDGDDMELIETWNRAGNFLEVGWENLGTVDPAAPYFVRVTGNATALQAADVIRAISKLRQNSQAFVITNAVKIEGSAEVDLAESAEDIRSVNVLEMLLSTLDDDQKVVVRKLLTEEGSQK